ncbi:MAG: cache domain-containing protein [Mangrovibacterium sp.]
MSVQQIITYTQLYDKLYQNELNNTRELVEQLVKHEIEYIDFRRLEIENQCEDNIKNQVVDAHRIASLIYNKHRATKSKAEIKKLIIEALSDIKNPAPDDRVNIYTLDGVVVWDVANPDLEGRNIKAMADEDGNHFIIKELDVVSSIGEGYVRYYTRPKIGERSLGLKVSYVKSFPELGWYFMALYRPSLEDRTFAQEIANKTNYTNFAHDGYSYLMERTGKMLCMRGKTTINDDVNLATHPISEVRASYQEGLERLEENPSGIFYELTRFDHDNNKEVALSYAVYYAPYDWVVGCTFSETALVESLGQHKSQMLRQIELNILIILLVSIVTFFLQYRYGQKLGRSIRRDFNELSEFFATAQESRHYIQLENLVYSESLHMAEAANDMVDELRVSLDNMYLAKKRAIKSDQLKSAFLANVSHEIRTPMNAIIGFTDLLSDDELDPQDRRELIMMVKDSGNDLLLLIESIINTAKIETGDLELDLAPVEISSILENSINFVKNKIIRSGKTIELVSRVELAPELIVVTDASRLTLVLHQILDNAVKFTPSGEICLQVELLNEQRLLFQISDSGIGVAPENQEAIFDNFCRVEDLEETENNLTRSDRGIGVGLSLCQTIVQALGGEIWVESELGKGSKFCFYICG